LKTAIILMLSSKLSIKTFVVLVQSQLILSYSEQQQPQQQQLLQQQQQLEAAVAWVQSEQLAVV
jgi:hypothetical protein